MQNKQLRVAFIGGGLNSAIGMTHKISVQMDNKFHLVSGCFSRNPIINRKTAEEWNIKNFYDSYINLLEHEKDSLDAVIILAPTNTHSKIILDILHFNIPIICEKTLTTSSDKAIEIQKKIQKNNSFLITIYNYTGYPMLRELKNMIGIGKLGEIIQINIQMPQESFIRLNSDGSITKPQEWRLEDRYIPTLSLDLGTHLSNMLYFLIQKKPTEVIAMENSFGHHNIVDNLNCMIRYEENIDCQMWYSKSALGHKNGLKVEVYGKEGSAVWYQMEPEFLEYNDNVGRNIRLDRSSKDIQIANQNRYNRFKTGHPAGFIEAFANHYSDIYQALLNYKNKNVYNSEYIFEINSSIEGLFLMEAIEKSIKSKKWEKIDVKNK